MPTQPAPKKHTKKKREPKSEATPRRPRSTPASPAAAPTLAVVQPGDEKYAPTAWGGSSDGFGPQDVTTPSGQMVLARRPGVERLMVEGVLHRMDNLTQIVDSKHIRKGKGKPDEINVASLMEDSEGLAELMHVVDRVLCAVVIKPSVHMTPDDVTRRVPGVIYCDTIHLQDKMFLFNFAMGGTRDLERFRQESTELVGSLHPGEPVEPQAE